MNCKHMSIAIFYGADHASTASSTENVVKCMRCDLEKGPCKGKCELYDEANG